MKLCVHSSHQSMLPVTECYQSILPVIISRHIVKGTLLSCIWLWLLLYDVTSVIVCCQCCVSVCGCMYVHERRGGAREKERERAERGNERREKRET